MSENKAKKIAQLYRKKLPGTIHPISTISMNGELIGYEMTYNPDYIVFEPFQIPHDETIHFLEKSKEILLSEAVSRGYDINNFIWVKHIIHLLIEEQAK